MVELAEAIMVVDLNWSKAPLLGNYKEKELVVGMSKRSRKKARETSSAFLPSSGVNFEFWKLEFSTYELGR